MTFIARLSIHCQEVFLKAKMVYLFYLGIMTPYVIGVILYMFLINRNPGQATGIQSRSLDVCVEGDSK